MSQPKRSIEINGARVHNLKNISVSIPHNSFVVITGLSGSGKSSLAFDTLFAEGQRRYVESLSSYARQFLGRLDKPDVDSIKGISPGIAIEQKVISRNPRSTLGTVTEIYDYFKVLFARIGKTYSPTTGEEVKKHTVSDVVNFVHQFEADKRYMILSPWVIDKKIDPKKAIEIMISQGFTKVWINGESIDLTEMHASQYQPDKSFIIIDRLKHVKSDEDYDSRLADSIQTAFYEGFGTCIVYNMDNSESTSFSNKFELDGIEFI